MIGHDAACSRHGSCALGGRRAYRQADCVSRTYSCRSGTGVRRPHGRSKNGLPITHRLRLTFALTVNDSFVPAPRVRYLFTFAPCVRHHPDPAPATANTLQPPLLCVLKTDTQHCPVDGPGCRDQTLCRADHRQHLHSSQSAAGIPPGHADVITQSRAGSDGRYRDLLSLLILNGGASIWLMCTRVIPNVLSGTCGGLTLCYSRLLFHMHWPPFLDVFRFLVVSKLP
jgi:hypothetical protein